MRIACPDCAAEYDVPDHLLVGNPRAMRCARCGRVWTPAALPEEALPPPEQEPEPEAAAESQPEPPPAPAAPAPAPAVVRRTGLLVAWLVTAAVIIGAVVGVVTRRDDLVRAWPPAERAYRAVGL